VYFGRLFHGNRSASMTYLPCLVKTATRRLSRGYSRQLHLQPLNLQEFLRLLAGQHLRPRERPGIVPVSVAKAFENQAAIAGKRPWTAGAGCPRSEMRNHRSYEPFR